MNSERFSEAPAEDTGQEERKEQRCRAIHANAAGLEPRDTCTSIELRLGGHKVGQELDSTGRRLIITRALLLRLPSGVTLWKNKHKPKEPAKAKKHTSANGSTLA